MMGRFSVLGLAGIVCLGVCGGASAAARCDGAPGGAGCVFIENTGQWNLPEVR